jgi:hypothetical protein
VYSPTKSQPQSLKIPSWKDRVFTATYGNTNTKEKRYLSSIPLTEVKFGRNEEIPQLWDFADNTIVNTIVLNQRHITRVGTTP